MLTKGTWIKLSNSWFRNSNNDVCFENVETLYLWQNIWNLHES